MKLSNFLPLVLLSFVILATGWQQANPYTRAKHQGKLTVAMRATPAVFYPHKDGYAGFEYELVEAFARKLNLALDIQIYPNAEQMEAAVLTGKAHLAAGNLGITQARQKKFTLSQPIQTAEQLVIYRTGLLRPKTWQDIPPTSSLAVLASSTEAQMLRQQQEDFPQLNWLETSQLTASDLLHLIQANELDYIFINSQDFSVNRFYFSRAGLAFNAATTEITWLFKQQQNSELAALANQFLTQATEEGLLENLYQRYYKHENQLNFAGAQIFLRRIKTTLPTYIDDFKLAAEQTGLDWHLLAALSFQESHWLPLAKSPTGVRGIMMLTQITADELKVDRLDAKESIAGGARYLKSLLNRIPSSVTGEHRLFMAMAAYNVGMGHLMDARRITQQQGFNPNIWEDVSKHLLLLSQRKWYKNTRYGYARGYEAVAYVENIRRYQQILLWQQISPDNLVEETKAKTSNLVLETAFQQIPRLEKVFNQP